jgi:hypothetical protein
VAKLFEIDKALQAWLSSRPPRIKAMWLKHPGNRLYRLAPTGQRVTIAAYTDNGTVKVVVSAEHNPGRSDVGRLVFGVDPNDLTECEPP